MVDHPQITAVPLPDPQKYFKKKGHVQIEGLCSLLHQMGSDGLNSNPSQTVTQVLMNRITLLHFSLFT